MDKLNDWFTRSASRPRRIQKVLPGQEVRIFERFVKDDITGEPVAERTKWIVDEVYPGFIRCHAIRNGRTVCNTFNLGDLVISGYEPVFP